MKFLNKTRLIQEFKSTIDLMKLKSFVESRKQSGKWKNGRKYFQTDLTEDWYLEYTKNKKKKSQVN